MRMILADDEVVITKGIQKLVDWGALGIEIIGVYEDGKSAFEGIVRLQPELALLDISMPGMTGVEIIRECAAMNLKTQIIFISGFQDFEYAKNALTYGAIDYLLKPVIREELMNAVEKCLINYQGFVTETKEEGLPANYSQLVEETGYIPVYVEVLYPAGITEQMERLIWFSFVSFLEEYLQEKEIGITFTRQESIFIVLKGLNLQEARQQIEEIWKKAREATSQNALFVMGRQVNKMSDIPEASSACEAMKEYSFFTSQFPIPIIEVGQSVFDRRVEEERHVQVIENMIAAMITQDIPVFEKCFEQFGKLVCWMADGKKEDACFYFCSAIRLAEEKIADLGIENEKKEMKDLLEAGRNCKEYSQLLEIYHSFLMQDINGIQKTAINSDKQNFLKAKNYIEQHYNEDITLNILADYVHMNPYYFSAFFKKNAGENFKDYVRKVRIRHAHSLLVSTNKKTYEIAVEVGFSDERTFSNVFQKYYHETPSAYRRRIKAT